MLALLWRFVAGATWLVLLLAGLAIGSVVGGIVGLAIGAVSFEFTLNDSLVHVCRNGIFAGGIAGAALGMAYATRVWLKTLTPDLAAE